jgi:hypothetical protein
MQKATITKTDHTGKIAQNRKEKGGFSNEYAVLVPLKAIGCDYKRPHATQAAIITARIYYTSGGTCHACVWINSPTRKDRHSVHVSGGGKAGGGGYHKASAALEHALNDAGIVLSDAIGGRGEDAMYDALAAVATALGYKVFHIHNAHA